MSLSAIIRNAVAGDHRKDWLEKAARVNAIGFAPSSGRIGVLARNRIRSSGDSGSRRRPVPCCAMKAKSFRAPSRLRFLLFPKAIVHIRERSSANVVSCDTDGAQRCAHGVRKDRREPPFLADRNDDRTSQAFADEQQVLLTADAQDVAIPVAEPGCRFPVG